MWTIIRASRGILLTFAALAATSAATAAPQLQAASGSPAVLAEDIAQLKAQLAAQQQEIESLRRALDTLKNDTAPPASPAAEPQIPRTAETHRALPALAAERDAAPLTFYIGNTTLTPVGFLDFTTVFRDKTGGSGIGTNFGNIPFGNTPPGRLSEFRQSAQNSRLGLRLDAPVGGAHVRAYLESDFLGIAPGNLAVSSNSNGLRMRLYWVDVSRKKFEVLAGQSWSLLTPNRSGLSPLPGDLFYTQDIDVNYQLGLTWSRDPQFRFVYHASPRLAVGLSVEAAEQYGGGSAGGGTINLPSALSSAYAGQVNTGGNNLATPVYRPDLIAKIAFDPRVGGRSLHVEAAGLMTGAKFFNPLNQNSYRATGGGASLNLNLEVVKNFHLITNNFHSDGGGRWIFGQAPDLIIRGDGSPSFVHASSTVSGFEYQAGSKLLLYAYYGGAYFHKNVATDPATGEPVGYGCARCSSNQNRAIQEATLGFTRTFWKNPRYGALQYMFQYSYLVRTPWHVSAGDPKSAHLNMGFMNLRYTLPGQAPSKE